MEVKKMMNWEFYNKLNDILDTLTANSHVSDFKNVDSLCDYSQMSVMRKGSEGQTLIQFDILGENLSINHWKSGTLTTQLLMCINGENEGKGVRLNVESLQSEGFTFDTPLDITGVISLIRELNDPTMTLLANDIQAEYVHQGE